MEYLEYFDTVPFKETCGDTLQEQRLEGNRLIALWNIVFPPPEGCLLKLKTNPHDFGSYATIEAWGDPDNDDHWEWVNGFSKYETWESLDAEAKRIQDGEVKKEVVLPSVFNLKIVFDRGCHFDPQEIYNVEIKHSDYKKFCHTPGQLAAVSHELMTLGSIVSHLLKFKIIESAAITVGERLDNILGKNGLALGEMVNVVTTDIFPDAPTISEFQITVNGKGS